MKSFEQRLEAESAGWVIAGIVSAEQRTQLLARHPHREAGAQRFLAILAGVGGVMLVVGVSLVIKSNWERIGDWAKIGGLVALLVGFAGAGWRCKLQPGNHPRTGDACLMVASVLFLLGIALVSQIFHLDSRPANGVLLWWAGIAAVPWFARARGAQFVSLVAGLTWLGMELMARDSWLRLAAGAEHGENGYALAAAGVLVGVALLLAGLGLRGGSRADFAGLHESVGLLLIGASLYALGFTWSVHSWSHHAPQICRWPPVLTLALLALAGAVWAAWRNWAGLKPLLWCLAPALVPALAQLLGADLGDVGWLWGGLACAAWFVLSIGMIRTGVATAREEWINLGVAFIALNIVTRYFLLFGTLLEGGVFFIVTGVLVLGLGWVLERQRRALVGRARQEVAS